MGTTANLKVVHLSSAHFAADTRILHKECKSLAKAGHDVTLVAQHEEDTILSGVKIKALRNPKYRWRRWTAALWRLYRDVARLDADLYHFHDPELIPVGMWLSLRGKRVIYDAHEDLPNTFAYKYYIPAFARQALGWLAGRIEDLAVQRFTAVVAATPTIGKRFSKYNTNTVVVRNFPSLAELALGVNLPSANSASEGKLRTTTVFVLYLENLFPMVGVAATTAVKRCTARSSIRPASHPRACRANAGI